MLTASMVLGVHVKIPVSALKVAPAAGPDCRLSVTSSPSLSDVVTFSVTSINHFIVLKKDMHCTTHDLQYVGWSQQNASEFQMYPL